MRSLWLAGLVFLGITRCGTAQEAAPIQVPFDTLKTRHMVVSVLVNDRGPYRLIFDTGAPTTLISQKLAREAGVIEQRGTSLLGGLFGSLGQKKIRSLKIGELHADKVDAMVMDHPIVEAIGKTLKDPIEGIVGLNVFGRYRLTIDYQAKRLEFVPGQFVPTDMMQVMFTLMFPSLDDLERPRVLSPRSLLGLRVDKKKEDEKAGVVVAEVFAGGPAARAGVKTGDRLLSLNGRWTDQVVDCFEAARLLEPGRGVRLEILRDGSRRTLLVESVTGF